MQLGKNKFKQADNGGIPEGWEEYRVGELFDLTPGYAFKSQDFRASGVPILKIKNVKAGRVIFDDLSYVDPALAVQREKYVVRKGDLLVTMSGNRIDGTSETWVGKVAQFKEERGTYLLNQRVGILRPKNQELSTAYCAYCLSSYEYQLHFINVATSSGGQANISPDMILSVPIQLPPLLEQRTIAKILSDLDAKIELNHQMNKIFESIASAIFKQWFVDFEFPGHEKTKFVNGLPQGWKEIPLTDAIDVLGGGTPSTVESSYWVAGLPFFTPKDVSENCYVIETEKRITLKGLENCNSQRYPRNTVFITARGTVGKVCMAGCDMAMNQSCYAIRSKNASGGGYYIYHLIKNLTEQLTQNAHGTVFETITTETFRKTQIVQPSKSIIDEFDSRVEPIYDLILLNMQESRNLSQIRDSLLPRLMSGKIRVKV